ncbi:MAG: YdcF family protein [Schaedlerella sp.]|nr:YdcF family protein [Schaedlerella sp.]
MQLYCLLMAAFCLLYYGIICIYTRRLNSTFSMIWILAGIFHIVLYILWGSLSKIVQNLVTIALIGLCILFLVVEMKILYAMKEKYGNTPQCLIILGAQVRGKRITNSLKRRLDKAVEVWRQEQSIRLIVSGGQGRGEDIPEAEAMAIYLLNQGIPSGIILKEDRSTSTWENLQFSKKYIDTENELAGIVTNNFHIYRALLLANDCGYQKICGIPADTNRILFLNYMVREFFAVVWRILNRN